MYHISFVNIIHTNSSYFLNMYGLKVDEISKLSKIQHDKVFGGRSSAKLPCGRSKRKPNFTPFSLLRATMKWSGNLPTKRKQTLSVRVNHAFIKKYHNDK